jgi:hypothetical protein
MPLNKRTLHFHKQLLLLPLWRSWHYTFRRFWWCIDEILGLRAKGLSCVMLPVGYRDSENDWLVNLTKVRKQRRLGYFDWLNKKLLLL